MPRSATGELRQLADGFAARITIEGRKRRAFPLASCLTADRPRSARTTSPEWHGACARPATPTRS
jgi:hypothetical protein